MGDSIKSSLIKERMPEHVAIIMDGNGRWAKKQGEVRIFGHQSAVKSVRNAVEAAAEIGIKYLTLYTFSTENWNRPKNEVDALMALLVATINNEIKTLNDNNVRLLAIGNLDSLPENVREELNNAIKNTQGNNGLKLVLALSYSGKWDITKAVNNILLDYKNGLLKDAEVTDEIFSNYLQTKNIPDPELLIRTSGEYRISNFLLWQLAYSELYFTDVLWPDFEKEDLYNAVYDYQKRERRFGKTSEQLQEN